MLASTLRRVLTVGVALSAIFTTLPAGTSAAPPPAPLAPLASLARAISPASVGGRQANGSTVGAIGTVAGIAGTASSAAQPGGTSAAQPAGVDPGNDGSVNYPPDDSGYHNYPEMVAHIQDVQAAHPDNVKVFSIGKSYQGRDIWAAEVSGDVTSTAPMPEVMFDGLHHSREHLAAEMSIYVLDLLMDNYGQATDLGTRVTNIVNTRRIWIVFMVNPDGLQYDLTGNPFRSWRKNRQPTPGSSSIGTDINRNYGYKWGCCGGSSSNPASDTYRGPAAWSTPEARAIRDFVLSRRIDGVQQIRAHITFHTAGKEILWPYGYTTTAVPKDMTVVDHNVFVAMGDHMAASDGYTPEQSTDLYPTDGDEIDWMYGTQRIFSYTFEMYPGPHDHYTGQRWYPPDEMIPALTQVNTDAVLYLMEEAGCPYASIGKATQYCGPYYDDMEMNRGWTVNANGTDTATRGSWQRGIPAVHTYQLAAWDGQGALVTGLSGADVDGGRTTITSPAIALPASATTLHLHYFVGFDSRANASDSFAIRLVDAAGVKLATALSIKGNGHARKPAWQTLTLAIPAALQGTTIKIELLATDGGADSTVEAGVDSVRITQP